jgi:methionyl-tRNA formyltransferase
VPLRIVFMGTPEFAAPYLSALLADGHTIPLVVTQPDRPKGRGQQLAAPPVKEAALKLGLAVAQPISLRTQAFHELIEAQAADLLVVVAFRILPDSLFPLARWGAVNVHGSLLPKYRGAAPIQWAIARGETETGVTIFQLDAEIDHGSIFARATTPIGPEETAGELFERLSHLGLELLRKTLREMESGDLTPLPQKHDAATSAPKLKKEDGLLDFHQSAKALHCRIRAFNPYPITYAHVKPGGKTLRIYRAHLVEKENLEALVPSGKPEIGKIYFDAIRYPIVATSDGGLRLLEVQAEGRPRVTGPEWVNGLRSQPDFSDLHLE